jgi:hypothetical protein
MKKPTKGESRWGVCALTIFEQRDRLRWFGIDNSPIGDTGHTGHVARQTIDIDQRRVVNSQSVRRFGSQCKGQQLDSDRAAVIG